MLAAIERCSLEEIAQILAVRTDKVPDLMEAGRQELAALAPASVVIIERESWFALEWAWALEDFGHSVIASVHTEADASALGKELRPDVVLAGSFLDGRFAYDTINQVACSYGAPLIIMSKYPEFSLTGEKQEAAYVINKQDQAPVVDAIVRVALFIERSGLARY
jgi:hypothetical protein